MRIENQHEETQALSGADLSPIEWFCAQHRTAVLVILFTDLEGSTELAEQKGENYARLVRHQHDAMLREIFERDGSGHYLKNIGDALMCVFAEPTAAVDRAVEAQNRIAKYNLDHPDEAPMKVRIGMHMGQVAVEENISLDVFGRHVNRAARIESLANGNQILMTEPVYDNASGWLAERGLRWKEHGRYRLKGIRDAVKIYEVCPNADATPQAPKGKRYRGKSWLAWAASLILVAALVPLAWLLRPAEFPLESSLDIRVMRGDQVFVDLNEAAPLRNNDRVHVLGAMSRPVYASLIWLDTLGDIQIVATSGDEKVTQIAFPPGVDEWAMLVGNAGTELCLLITSAQPLTNLDSILQRISDEGQFPDLGRSTAIWIQEDGLHEVASSRTELEQDRGLGPVVHKSSEQPQYRADKLRQLLNESGLNFEGVAVGNAG